CGSIVSRLPALTANCLVTPARGFYARVGFQKFSCFASAEIDMQIDEAFADSQAPNAAAIKNARGVVIKKKLVGLFRSADGMLIFGDCKGSDAEIYRPSADFADPSKPVYRCTCPSHQFPCKHALALLYARAQGA